ncbi:unnamed protein product [Heterobilharzia americana]|nr:unnamed protein product [Heterobilharzia americana]
MYSSFKEAHDKPDGLAVLALLRRIDNLLYLNESQMSRYANVSGKIGSYLVPGTSETSPEFHLPHTLSF